MQIVSSKHWDTLLMALFSWDHRLEASPMWVAWGCGVRISTGTGGVLGKQSIISWAGIWTLQRFPWQEHWYDAFFGNIPGKARKMCPVLCLFWPVSSGQKKEVEVSITWNNSGILYLCLIISGLCTDLGDFFSFYRFLKILQECVVLV